MPPTHLGVLLRPPCAQCRGQLLVRGRYRINKNREVLQQGGELNPEPQKGEMSSETDQNPP